MRRGFATIIRVDLPVNPPLRDTPAGMPVRYQRSNVPATIHDERQSATSDSTRVLFKRCPSPSDKTRFRETEGSCRSTSKVLSKIACSVGDSIWSTAYVRSGAKLIIRRCAGAQPACLQKPGSRAIPDGTAAEAPTSARFPVGDVFSVCIASGLRCAAGRTCFVRRASVDKTSGRFRRDRPEQAASQRCLS
jgi:hypothetical protein